MKIIDLFDIIAKGEEPPMVIKYDDAIWVYDNSIEDYASTTNSSNILFAKLDNLGTRNFINSEIEVISGTTEAVEKAIAAINDMLYNGYVDGETQLFATGEQSEFGVRAKVILNILKGDRNE